MSDESLQSSRSSAGATPDEFHALQTVISTLRGLDPEARNRILESASTFLGIAPVKSRRAQNAISGPSLETPFTSRGSRALFSEDTTMSAKDFLNEKTP